MGIVLYGYMAGCTGKGPMHGLIECFLGYKTRHPLLPVAGIAINSGENGGGKGKTGENNAEKNGPHVHERIIAKNQLLSRMRDWRVRVPFISSSGVLSIDAARANVLNFIRCQIMVIHWQMLEGWKYTLRTKGGEYT
jgi:hypothetical protein